jgi:hypothetical protein
MFMLTKGPATPIPWLEKLSTVRALSGRLSALSVSHSKSFFMALLYGRAGRLTAQNGGLRRGQSTNKTIAAACMFHNSSNPTGSVQQLAPLVSSAACSARQELPIAFENPVAQRWRCELMIGATPIRSLAEIDAIDAANARGADRDKSDCHFRKTATDYDRKPGTKRLSCTAK